MSSTTITSYRFMSAEQQNDRYAIRLKNEFGDISTAELAAAITKQASTQTFYTIHYLVDRPLVADAYRAYAYFRWVDDTLDQAESAEEDRLAFLTRQQNIIAQCIQGLQPVGLCPEERMVADLIQGDKTESNGLRIYIREMMAVMSFDAKRKDHLISQKELNEYTRSLATAVTEALHYFIGHYDSAPQDGTRYLAVTGAHITHMLRDLIEDTAVGYYNIPEGFFETYGFSPTELNHDAIQIWVRSQVKLARNYFKIGRKYMARVENLRCRLAGYAYIARFEVVLDAIEKDGYRLRSAYPERKSKKASLKMVFSALTQTILISFGKRPPSNPDLMPAPETA